MSFGEHKASPQKKLPRSYQAGKLLTFVVNEFKSFTHKTDQPRRIELISNQNNLSFYVTELVEKNFLAHTVIAEFEYHIGGSLPGQAKIQLEHTGNLRRTGIRARLKQGGDDLTTLIQTLQTDPQFLQAIIPLDFNTFYLIQDHDGWRVQTTQVGASWVNMAFPPVRRYVKMGPEQIEALLATFNRLQTILGNQI